MFSLLLQFLSFLLNQEVLYVTVQVHQLLNVELCIYIFRVTILTIWSYT